MRIFLLLLTSAKSFSYTGFIVIILYSCSSIPDSGNSTDTVKVNTKKQWEILSPGADQVLHFNDSLQLKIEALNKNVHADSTQVFIEGKKILTENKSPIEFARTGIFSKVGRQDIRIRIFFNDSLSQTLSTRITVLSDSEAIELNFVVIREFTHSTNSYTQGYIYRNKYIYEGTGGKKNSRIQKIDPLNGRVHREIKMDDAIFGEGITELNSKLYQLTYQNKLGFVYDLVSFEKIQEFELQTYEGWGLTTDGENLIVSEGSSILYFYNPEDFTQVKQLDVSDKKGLIPSLNELEYVKGAIWANVYNQLYIVKIDAETGRLEAKLDLTALFPNDIPRDYDHVLNGIAYNPDNDSFFITGKFWPVVYEIKILE